MSKDSAACELRLSVLLSRNKRQSAAAHMQFGRHKSDRPNCQKFSTQKERWLGLEKHSCKLSNFDLLNCNKLLLHNRQNLHLNFQPTTCRQTYADFSPSPWWLTTHIWRSCEIRLSFVKRHRRLVNDETCPRSCRRQVCFSKLVETR